MCWNLLNEEYAKHIKVVLKYAWTIRIGFPHRIERIGEWDFWLRLFA